MAFTRKVENMIAAFRGLPTDRSVSKLRETAPVGDLVAGVMEKYRVGMPSREDTIMQNWDKVVGAANASYSHLMRIENERRVFIAVTNSIVRQELFFHRKLVLERIQALPGCKDLRDLRLLTG
jgi:hypothetical protein